MKTMRTANGHEILYAKLVSEGDEFRKRGWIVLCGLPDNTVHPYVTWWMAEDGITSQGDYCETLKAALISFEARR